MKTRIITTVVALFSYAFIQAQVVEQAEIETEMKTGKGITFHTGDMFAEGSLKVSTGGAEEVFGFNPKFGYFIKPKLAVGAAMNIGSTKIKAQDYKTNIFSIGAFARYYCLELDHKRFKAYTEVGFGFGHNKQKTAGISDNNNSITADINVGLNYFFTKNIAATFTLANILSYNSVKPENGSSTDTFTMNLNLFNNIFDQPQFGLLYKF